MSEVQANDTMHHNISIQLNEIDTLIDSILVGLTNLEKVVDLVLIDSYKQIPTPEDPLKEVIDETSPITRELQAKKHKLENINRIIFNLTYHIDF